MPEQSSRIQRAIEYALCFEKHLPTQERRNLLTLLGVNYRDISADMSTEALVAELMKRPALLKDILLVAREYRWSDLADCLESKTSGTRTRKQPQLAPQDLVNYWAENRDDYIVASPDDSILALLPSFSHTSEVAVVLEGKSVLGIV